MRDTTGRRSTAPGRRGPSRQGEKVVKKQTIPQPERLGLLVRWLEQAQDIDGELQALKMRRLGKILFHRGRYTVLLDGKPIEGPEDADDLLFDLLTVIADLVPKTADGREALYGMADGLLQVLGLWYAWNTP